MSEKLKSFVRSEQTFYAVLLCVIALVAFMLGRYSVAPPELQRKTTNQSAGVVFIDAPEQPESAVNSVDVVASKNGTKYHLSDCPGAATIKKANLIRFASSDLARAAGYTPAANCEF